jgi:hypothetical protein
MASRLDGAGQAKLATLDDALTQLQHVHAIVERMAIASRAQSDTRALKQQVARAASPLVGLLKPQFGTISDQVAQVVLITSRGGTEQMKVRALRELVAQVRMQIELTQARVKEQHTTDEPRDAAPKN